MPLPFLINGFVITCTWEQLSQWKLAHNYTSPRNAADREAEAYGYGQNRYCGD